MVIPAGVLAFLAHVCAALPACFRLVLLLPLTLVPVQLHRCAVIPASITLSPYICASAVIENCNRTYIFAQQLGHLITVYLGYGPTGKQRQ